MRFVKSTVSNSNNGVEAEVYLPVDLHSIPNLHTDSMVEVDVDGEPRVLSARVIEMLARFNLELEKRNRLGQECGAFALACVSGCFLEDIAFGPEQIRIIVTDYSISHSPEDTWQSRIYLLAR